MKCHCQEYLSPLKTVQEVQIRCEARDLISKTLVEVASDFMKWMSVSQCKVCKLYWAREYYLGDEIGNCIECFYHIRCKQPHQWLKDHKGSLRS